VLNFKSVYPVLKDVQSVHTPYLWTSDKKKGKWLISFHTAVICAIHGYAFGIATDICSAADVRVCAQDTIFCVKEVDLGIASDVGILSRLPKAVGSYTWVKDVAMTGRNFGADEALRVGFVSSVLPTKEGAVNEAFKIASVLSEKSPVAVQTVKHFLDYSRDHTVAEGIYELPAESTV
jgi:delta(3,5)-delta(2,4)-dienoyl-CoA isomerase